MVNGYSGALTREQFLFYEIRAAASLRTQGMNREEILEKVRSENLFQFPTERMVPSILKTCLRRMDGMDSAELVDLLANGSIETAKQVNLYAMMCDNRLVWDFMTVVIGDKFRTQECSFSRKDLNLFFFHLQEENNTVAGWSDSTIQKIKQVLTKALVECGYLDSPRAQQLNPVAIAPELEDAIRNAGNTKALPAFNCFREI